MLSPTRSRREATWFQISGFGVWGFGFGFRVSGFGFQVSGLGFWFRVSGFGFLVSGFWFRVLGLGFRFLISGSWFLVSGIGFRISSFGFWVSGFGREASIDTKRERREISCVDTNIWRPLWAPTKRDHHVHTKQERNIIIDTDIQRTPPSL